MPDAPADPAPAASRSTVRLPAALSALRHPGYRVLTTGMAPGMLAMQMSSVALGYLAYQLSNSATALGLIGLGWGLPMLFLSLAGGVVADRLPRRTILLVTQAVVGSAALLGAILLLAGVIQVWHLFIIALIQGISFAFNMPARQALIADLVGPEDLGNAIAFNNTVINVTRVIGPPVAGALIAVPAVGLTGVYILMASTYIIVLAVLARLPRVAAPIRLVSRSGWGDLREGLSYIGHSPALLALLALAFAPMFFGMPHQLLLPVFALSVFEAGAIGLGWLNMASGLGALAGSVLVTILATSPRQRLYQLLLGIVFAVGLIGVGLAQDLLLAAVLLAVVGAASAGYMSINNTLIMQEAPRPLQGRIMSVYMMTFSLMPLASLPAARLTDLIGAPATVGGMGALLLVAIIGVTLWQRRATVGPLAAATPAPLSHGD